MSGHYKLIKLITQLQQLHCISDEALCVVTNVANVALQLASEKPDLAHTRALSMLRSIHFDSLPTLRDRHLANDQKYLVVDFNILVLSLQVAINMLLEVEEPPISKAVKNVPVPVAVLNEKHDRPSKHL